MEQQLSELIVQSDSQLFSKQLERLQREFRRSRLSQKIGTRYTDVVFTACLNLQHACKCLERMCAENAGHDRVAREGADLSRYVIASIGLITSESDPVAKCVKNIAWLLNGPDEIVLGAQTRSSAQDLIIQLGTITGRE